MDGKTIINRFAAVKDARSTAQEEWDLIRRFVYPIGGGKFWEPQTSEHQMSWRAREVFDDTAIIGADTLASSIHGAITPSGSKWFDAKFRSHELQQDSEAVEWLDTCMQQVWDEIQGSNFDLEVGET